MRIRQRSVRSGPGDRGPRELRLLERVSIRVVPGVRPGRPADTGRGRGLVRPARRRGRRPCPGLAGGRPPWPGRDRPIWSGYSPRRPGTRPDLAGRQRQPVFLTRSPVRLAARLASSRSAAGCACARCNRRTDTQRRAGVIRFTRTGPLSQLGPAVRGRWQLAADRRDVVMTAPEQARPSWADPGLIPGAVAEPSQLADPDPGRLEHRDRRSVPPASGAVRRALSRDRTRCPRCPASRCTTRCRHRQAVAARVPRRARPDARIRPQAWPGAHHPRARCRPARQDATDS